jgi:hypothetical protein
VLVCAFVLRTLPPAAPPASPVALALAPARGMIGRALRAFYITAFFLFLLYTFFTSKVLIRTIVNAHYES